MLPSVDRFEYTPYAPNWWESDRYCQPEIMSDTHPDIVAYIEDLYAEDIRKIRPQLLDELARSEVPYSRMHTACALETFSKRTPFKSGLYFGHREESLDSGGGLHVVTALEMALNKIESEEEKVVGVYLTGRDLPAGKLKRMMPLPTDYDHLAKRFDEDWGPTFLLIPPDSYGWPPLQGLRLVWAANHAKAYAQHERVELSGWSPDLTLAELEYYTNLKDDDKPFVTDLTGLAYDAGWTVFFTGSASGLGEITPLLTGEYDDMDFIVVAEEPQEAELQITALAVQHYGLLTTVPEVAYDTYGGKKIKGFFLVDQSGKKRIQLAVGKTMDEVCFRPDVIARNSGVWLNS